jgi:hypothetical protein
MGPGTPCAILPPCRRMTPAMDNTAILPDRARSPPWRRRVANSVSEDLNSGSGVVSGSHSARGCLSGAVLLTACYLVSPVTPDFTPFADKLLTDARTSGTSDIRPGRAQLPSFSATRGSCWPKSSTATSCCAAGMARTCSSGFGPRRVRAPRSVASPGTAGCQRRPGHPPVDRGRSGASLP